MKNKTARKKPAVNKIYYIYVGILAVLFFIFIQFRSCEVFCTALQTGKVMETGTL